MKIVELTDPQFSFNTLLQGLEREDVLLVEKGRPKARLEQFTEDDLADWLFEHDPKVIQDAEKERQRLKKGEGIPWELIQAKIAAKEKDG